MPASLRHERNRHRALGAILCCGRGCRRWLCHPTIHRAHHQKHRKCNNQKIDNRVEKNSVIQRRRARCLRCCQRLIRLVAKIEKQVRKIHVPQQSSQGRHQNVIHCRRYDFPECCTDDDADCHVQHVAAHRKFFEFLQHASSPSCCELSRSLDLYGRRETNTHPTNPRNTRRPPAAANNGNTQLNGTREITSINPPTRIKENPPTRSTRYVRSPLARSTVIAPHTINSAPTASHEVEYRFGNLCVTSASQRIKPPSSATITSMNNLSGSCIW